VLIHYAAILLHAEAENFVEPLFVDKRINTLFSLFIALEIPFDNFVGSL